MAGAAHSTRPRGPLTVAAFVSPNITPFSKGGAVLADGLLLATDGKTKLYVIEPDPAGFKPLASAELLEAANNWAPIALVDGRLLIRDQKQMKCVQVGRP